MGVVIIMHYCVSSSVNGRICGFFLLLLDVDLIWFTVIYYGFSGLLLANLLCLSGKLECRRR